MGRLRGCECWRSGGWRGQTGWERDGAGRGCGRGATGADGSGGRGRRADGVGATRADRVGRPRGGGAGRWGGGGPAGRSGRRGAGRSGGGAAHWGLGEGGAGWRVGAERADGRGRRGQRGRRGVEQKREAGVGGETGEGKRRGPDAGTLRANPGSSPGPGSCRIGPHEEVGFGRVGRSGFSCPLGSGGNVFSSCGNCGLELLHPRATRARGRQSGLRRGVSRAGGQPVRRFGKERHLPRTPARRPARRARGPWWPAAPECHQCLSHPSLQSATQTWSGSGSRLRSAAVARGLAIIAGALPCPSARSLWT